MSEPCHDPLREDLPLLASGDLEHDEAAALTAHVAGCAACRDELAGLREAVRAVGSLSAGECDDGPLDVAGALSERLGMAGPRRRGWIPSLARAAAAALLFAGGMGAERLRATERLPTPAKLAEGPLPVTTTTSAPGLEAAWRERAAAADDGLARALLALRGPGPR